MSKGTDVAEPNKITILNDLALQRQSLWTFPKGGKSGIKSHTIL